MYDRYSESKLKSKLNLIGTQYLVNVGSTLDRPDEQKDEQKMEFAQKA